MAQRQPGDGPAKRDSGRRASSAPKKGARSPGNGARAAKSDRTEAELTDSETASSQGRGALVLVVDDYQDAREMCREDLSYCGFRVAEARNGHEAIEKAISLLPDLILMDLSLPGMDGWEATRRLKADEKTCKIPVVALTGHALAGHSEGAKAAGCDAFVTKPCMPDQLVAEVKRVLEGPKPKSRSSRQFDDTVFLQHDVFRQHAVDTAAERERLQVRTGFAAWPALEETAGDLVAGLDPQDARPNFHHFAGAVG